jgi:transposase
MFSLTSSLSYYLYNEPADMRKSFDGLCGLVESRLTRNPMSGEVFIFINKRRDHIKLLHWEPGGFTLYYKRLESGTIELPRWDPDTCCFHLMWSDLMMMVEGISMEKIHRRKRYILTKQCV